MRLFKLVHDPGDIEPDCVYLIKREGQNGFDIKVSDSNGELLYPLNCCSDGTPGEPTGLPYKTYTAVLLQSGGSAPFVAEELQNDFGQGLELTYNRPGSYRGYMPGAFRGQTIIFCNAYHSGEGFPRAVAARKISDDEIEITCSEDDNYINLDVRVYE